MAVFEIESPDGELFEIEAPDDATEDEVMAFAQDNFTKASQDVKKGFFERLGDRVEERQLEVSDTFSDLAEGKVGPKTAFVQTQGKVAGAALDIIGETIFAGFDAVTPEPVQDALAEGVDFLFNKTDTGQAAVRAIGAGVDEWKEFKDDNPQTAKTVESVANLGLLFAPAKANPGAAPSKLAKGAKALEQAAGRQTRQTQRSFLTELIRKNELKDVFRTRQEGLLRKNIFKPNKKEMGIMQELNKTPGVTKNKSFQGNFNAALDEISKEGNKLVTKLDDVADPRIKNVLEARMQFAINDIKINHPAFVGADATKVADSIANQAKHFLTQNSSSPQGVLKARQQLDRFVLNATSESKAFGEGSWAVANRSIRDMMNQTIDDFASNVAVKKSLTKQSKLYGALDRIAPKAFAENKNAFSRLYGNVGKVIGVRSKLLSEAALVLGTTTLGASQVISGPLAAVLATGYTGYKLGQAFGSASAKKALSSLLKATDRALVTSKNPRMLSQLRADRAAVIEMLKAHKDVEDDPNVDQNLQKAKL